MLARVAIAAFAAFTACDYGPDGVPSGSEMSGFSWVIEGSLAGMPRPGRAHPLEQDLAFLARARIDLLVSLTIVPPDPELVDGAGIELLHLPVADFTAPTPDQIHTFIDRSTEVIDSSGRAGVHCGAGLGRTGTMLATYFVNEGYDPAAAIAHVRQLRPGSIETAEQEAAIFAYYRARLLDDRPGRR